MNEHRVAIYIRVGNKDQLIASAAVQQQKQELERFAKENNMTVVGHYYDIGFSGRELDRPGLKGIISDGKKKMFQSVLVPKHDNLYRGNWLNAPKWPFNVIAKKQCSRARER